MGEDELGMELFSMDEMSDLGATIEPVDGGDTPPAGEEPEKDPKETADNAAQEEIDNKEELGEGETPDIVGKTTEDGDPEPPEEGGEANTSPDLYKAFATVLQEKGVFTSVDPSKLDEVKDVDNLVELIKGEITRHELEDLNDLQRSAIEAYREGVPADLFNEHVEVSNQLASITPESVEAEEELRQTLIFQEYKSKGYSDDKANKLTKRSFDLDEDVEDAKAALEALKVAEESKFESEKTRLAEESAAAKQKIENERTSLKNKIFNTNEVIKGDILSEVVKQKVYDDMMTPVSINPETNKEENKLMKFQRENPEDFSHKLYYLFSVTNGFSDLSRYTDQGRSSSVNDLENAIRNSTHVSGGGDPSFIDDVNSSFLDIGDELIID